MDDCIGSCGHVPETAQLETVIDTRPPEARRWATDVYDACRREARPLEIDEWLDVDRGGGGDPLHVEPL